MAEVEEHRGPYANTSIVNQETERVFEVLYEIFCTVHSQGHLWMKATDMVQWLCAELGYEDEDELEDSLQGTLLDYLKGDDRVTVKREEAKEGDETPEEERPWLFQVEVDPPQEEWVPRRLRLVIREIKELWNVLYKSKHAHMTIPEITFTIYREGHKHKVDSLFNHISGALMNCEREKQITAVSSIEADLQSLLDVDKPFTFIIDDESGISRFKNMENVQIEEIPDADRMQQITEEGEMPEDCVQIKEDEKELS